MPAIGRWPVKRLAVALLLSIPVLLATPVATDAQPPDKVYRIGLLDMSPGFDPDADPLDQGDEQMSRLPKLTRSWMLLGVLLAGVLVGASTATALEVGEKAPDFTLPGTTGEKISLSQFRGKKLVLIEFYVGESPT
jgi:hypothetical protein